MVCRSAKRTLRHLAFALPLALFVVFAYPIRAQTFDATHLREPANLAMKWLVQAGDNPAYASPDFDDSHWTLFDPSSSIESLFPRHPEVCVSAPRQSRLHTDRSRPQRDKALACV